MKIEVQSGDLYLLGDNRLLCGDCRLPDNQARLMAGARADLALHDPPYGAGQSLGFGDGHVTPAGVTRNGKRHGRAVRGVFTPMAGDDEPLDPSHLLDSGKTVVLFGANNYADRLPPSPAWLVWDKRKPGFTNNLSDAELAWVSTGGSVRMLRHMWNGWCKDSERGEQRLHPTQKPVTVFAWIIEKYCPLSGLVTDWYVGSGTTLIAAERTGRTCYAMELLPEYCRVTIERWMKETGGTPVRVGADDNTAV